MSNLASSGGSTDGIENANHYQYHSNIEPINFLDDESINDYLYLEKSFFRYRFLKDRKSVV